MDVLAHAIPVVGDRPNGPFPRLGRALLLRGVYLRQRDRPQPVPVSQGSGFG
jgi:hypothetical protein